MATIKYKYKDTWRNLEVPITINFDGGAPYKYVEITGSTSNAPFPDLSPYISDLSQIAFLSWSEETVNDNQSTVTFETDTFIYCPLVSSTIINKQVVTKASRTTTDIQADVNVADDSRAFVLGGTPAAVKLIHSNGTQSGAHYVGKINLYYKEVEQ